MWYSVYLNMVKYHPADASNLFLLILNIHSGDYKDDKRSPLLGSPFPLK